MEELQSRVDIKSRLHNSVIMYDNLPHYVMVEDRDVKDTIHNVRVLQVGLNGGPSKIVDYRTDDFSSKSPPLGYCKHGSYVGYMERVPSRQFSAGLTRHNMVDRSGNLYVDEALLLGEGFKNCILGTHPSFNECFNNIINGSSSYEAFDRHFCLKKIGKQRAIGMFFREEEVARLGRNGTKYKVVPLVPDTLIPRYNQLLEKHGVKFNELF